MYPPVISILFVAILACSSTIALGAILPLSLLFAMVFLIGRIVARVTKVDDPFIEFVAGLSIVAHLMMAMEPVHLLNASLMLTCIVCLAFVALKVKVRLRDTKMQIVFSTIAAIYTVIWCWDLSSRLEVFKATGELRFWSDILLHAGTVAQFSSTSAIGRGTIGIADVHMPLYHIATYMPAAFIATVSAAPPLDIAILVWIPLGIVTMISGIIGLSYAIGGRSAVIATLVATAVFPNSGESILHNGLLSVPWLLETAPGTAYSLGVACAAIAMLVYWMRTERLETLAAAVVLGILCLLVRANTFIWLAPTLFVSSIVGVSWLSKRQKILLVIAALSALCVCLIALSWQQVRSDSLSFTLSYIETVHHGQDPTAYPDLYPWFVSQLGRMWAAPIGLALIFLGILGPWLAIFLAFGATCWARGRCQAYDFFPVALLIVAAVMMVLAPVPPNGDITEFRHRGSPLLFVVIVPWCARFLALMLPHSFHYKTSQNQWRSLLFLCTLSLATMAILISGAKRPRMEWAQAFYDRKFPVDLLKIASELRSTHSSAPRFVVADQPSTARDGDIASMLAGLSGIPAYISRPQLFSLRNDSVGDEAKRRMEVARQLDQAPTVETLKNIMRSEGITFYVVTEAFEVRSDPNRLMAEWKVGTYAIYRFQ